MFSPCLAIYTQALSLAGVAIVTVVVSMQMQIAPDSTLLMWQFFGLLSIPGYVYLIKRKSENQLRLARENLESTVKERTQELIAAVNYSKVSCLLKVTPRKSSRF